MESRRASPAAKHIAGRRPAPAGRLTNRLLLVIFASIWLATMGLIFSLMILFGGGAAERRIASYGVGEDVPTSFGTLTVAGVDTVAGLTPDALAGMAHGVEGLVPKDSMEIEAALTLRNSTGKPVRYSSRSFGLAAAGSDVELLPVVSTLGEGHLAPGSSVTGAVKFIVPGTGTEHLLLFHDKPSHGSLIVSLGSTEAIPGPSQVGDHAGPTHGP